MSTAEAQTPAARGAVADSAFALPLTLLLRFANAEVEQRFVAHCVAVYLRYAQVSLILGMVLIAGDFLVDRITYGHSQANLMRLTLAMPALLGALACTWLPGARRHWQSVMAGFIVSVALGLFVILARLDAEGGQGLRSWVGVLNFTFLEFYCFVILGVQFRHALASGLAILAIFHGALWMQGGLSAAQMAYGSYHVVTVFILAAGIGWWREYLLRKEFMARTVLEDSRAAAEERALRLAHYDEVTGLPNRRLFGELCAPALERSRRGDMHCAVLHVEIDRFSGVHGVFGRGRGDAVLADMAQRLRRCIRGSDVAAATVHAPGLDPNVVARLGDSAFSILVADLGGQSCASAIAQRLLAEVAQPIAVDGQPVVLSASIGIAIYPGDATDLEGLMHCAEQAGHAAVSAGGAQHRFFDEALDSDALARVVLETELRQAIQDGQLCLHYQPKVDARDGRLIGAESLVRWQHPQRGLVPPGRFIPLAEACGLIVPLTQWVLQEACSSLRRWSDQGWPALTLSVNLPACSLADPALPEQLEALIREHRLQPSRLVLELTETMVMQDLSTSIDVLERLRAMGFGLSLDDFGTGYSSLSCLTRLPMHELKLDRAFVTDVARGGRDSALATAVIALGKELGLQVVAEGVETVEQSAFLLERGCTMQQGYLFSRPVPQAAFEQILQAGTTRVDNVALA